MLLASVVDPPRVVRGELTVGKHGYAVDGDSDGARRGHPGDSGQRVLACLARGVCVFRWVERDFVDVHLLRCCSDTARRISTWRQRHALEVCRRVVVGRQTVSGDDEVLVVAVRGLNFASRGLERARKVSAFAGCALRAGFARHRGERGCPFWRSRVE